MVPGRRERLVGFTEVPAIRQTRDSYSRRQTRAVALGRQTRLRGSPYRNVRGGRYGYGRGVSTERACVGEPVCASGRVDRRVLGAGTATRGALPARPPDPAAERLMTTARTLPVVGDRRARAAAVGVCRQGGHGRGRCCAEALDIGDSNGLAEGGLAALADDLACRHGPREWPRSVLGPCFPETRALWAATSVEISVEMLRTSAFLVQPADWPRW